ncbi:MAG: DUF6291 domain-containing protein [Oscillospiraceae bacterium]|nr:DUF6291 domain-containing protein [Oscillospiraceae bacterium]
MHKEKKSFLIYMDAYLHIITLPAEQRGELFSSLFWYAGQVAKKGYMDVTVAAAQCPGLSPETRMAFYFMADSIQRDTIQWLEKQANYQAAAERREEKKRHTVAPMPFKGRGVDVYPSDEEAARLSRG